MIGGLSLWVPNEAVEGTEVHDHVEPINLRVSPQLVSNSRTKHHRIDGLSVSAEGRLAATQGSPGGGSHELGIPRSPTTDHSANQRLAARDRAVEPMKAPIEPMPADMLGLDPPLNEALMVESTLLGGS